MNKKHCFFFSNFAWYSNVLFSFCFLSIFDGAWALCMISLVPAAYSYLPVPIICLSVTFNDTYITYIPSFACTQKNERMKNNQNWRQPIRGTVSASLYFLASFLFWIRYLIVLNESIRLLSIACYEYCAWCWMVSTNVSFFSFCII